MQNAAFHRTRSTWQAYLTIAYFSYLVNTLGPLAPFLRDELRLSYTIASLHMSAYAFGTVLTGLFASRYIRRFGAQRVLWSGSSGMALGALLIMTGRHPVLTIGGAFLMGLMGIVIIAIFQIALVEQYGEQRAIALTESTVVASMLATLAPVAVGFFARTPLSWRAALAAGVLLLIGLWLAFRRNPAPGVGSSSMPAAGQAGLVGSANRQRARLPFRYWLYWFAALLSVSIEFCYILWGADYLEKVAGLARPNAALGMSVYMFAILAGRVVNSRLVWSVPAVKLVKASLLLSGAGFLLFWLGPGLPGSADGLTAAGPGLAWPVLAGMGVAGLGVAGLYPLLTSLALGACPGQTVEGSAAFTLSAGTAILALPLLLGRLADWIGIHLAYGLVAALIVLALAIVYSSEMQGSALRVKNAVRRS